MSEKQTCKCGKGKVSQYDGKCGHCRTKREREAHRKLTDDLFRNPRGITTQ